MARGHEIVHGNEPSHTIEGYDTLMRDECSTK